MSEQENTQPSKAEGAQFLQRKKKPVPDGVRPPQDLSAEEVRMRLKSERVQIALAAIPDWTQDPDGNSLQRVRQFAQATVAKAYVGYVLEVATAFKLPVSLQWADRQLVITLRGFSQKSRQNGITLALVNLATALG
jgi:hypothetical protein